MTQVGLDSEVRADGDRIILWIWTAEEDPTWIHCQIDCVAASMKGYHVSRCEGTIPKVTSFEYEFPSQENCRDYHLHLTMAILAEIGGETLIRSGEETDDGDAGKLGVWQEHMAAFGKQQKDIPPEAFDTPRTVFYPRELEMPPGLVQVEPVGRPGIPRTMISIPHKSGLHKIVRMSGFDAIAIANSNGLPEGLRPGDMGDPDIENSRIALAYVDKPSSHVVSWYGVRDESISSIRMQAASAMPVLADLLAKWPTPFTTVDDKKQLLPALMKITGLRKASLRRMSKLRACAPTGKLFDADERIVGVDALGVNRDRHIQVDGAAPLDSAIRILAELSPDWTPGDDDSWLKFNDIMAATAIPLQNATLVPEAEILGAFRGGWGNMHGSLARAADFAPEEFDRRAMALATVDAIDAIEHFRKTVVLPQVLAKIAETGEPEPEMAEDYWKKGFEAAANLLLLGSGNLAVRAMELSRRYASRIPAIMEIECRSALAASEIAQSRFASYGPTGFPLLTREFAASNGLMVRPLAHGEALCEESRRLQHCVGSYLSRARRMICHIYSIQDASGANSFSTFELTAVEGDDPRIAVARLRLVQHRARSNSMPSGICVAACKEFLEALKSGAVEINLSEIRDWRNWLSENGLDTSVSRATPGATWISVLEHDWDSEETQHAFWKEWGAVLGGRFTRSPHPGVIWTEKKVLELLSDMMQRDDDSEIKPDR